MSRGISPTLSPDLAVAGEAGGLDTSSSDSSSGISVIESELTVISIRGVGVGDSKSSEECLPEC